MRFGLSPEQDQLRVTLREFLSQKAPVETAQTLVATQAPYDADLFHTLTHELGVAALAIPEAYSGAGFTAVETAVVFEELGRVVLPSPFFATVGLAATTIQSSGDIDAMRDYLPGIAAGDVTGALAVFENDTCWSDPGETVAVPIDSVPDTDGTATHRLTGTKNFVIDGATADLILVAANSRVGRSIFAVQRDAAGVRLSPEDTLDQTRRQASISFSGTAGRLIGTEGEGGRILAEARNLASVALAAEALGGAQRCLEISVQYAKDRLVFNRQLGSFQAIKHLCASMLVEVESARSAVMYAAWAAAESPAELRTAAPLALAFSADTYFRAAADTIQILGGTGFTLEHEAHLYFKRAKVSQLILGSTNDHRELLAAGLGI